MYRFLIILSLSLFLSCNKSGHGYVRGTIYEKGTNNPLANVKVVLSHSFHHNSNVIFDDSVRTDNNGHYKIKFYMKRGNAYIIAAFSDVDYDDFELKTKKTVKDLSLKP